MFVFDDWKPIGEFDEWNNFQAWNVYGPGADEILLRQMVTIGYTIFLLDRHGNVAFLVNNDGVVLENCTYDVFGQPTITITESGQKLPSSWYHHDFLFQGREYIAPLGIYDFRNRYYRPELGRFIESDPKGFDAGDMNLFRYCGDDPVDLSDPTGLEGEQWSYEHASSVARSKAIAAQFAPDVKSVTVNIKPSSNSIVGIPWTYVPSKMVAVLKSPSGHGYEVLNPVDGKPRFNGYVGGNPQFLEIEGGNLTRDQMNRAANLVHIHNNTKSGIAAAGNSVTDDNLYKQGVAVERMDATDRKSWHRREPNGKGGYKDSIIPADGAPRSGRGGGDGSGNGGASAGSGGSSGPTARDIDLAHQDTGVPSLGQESVNFAPGRP